jgi:hypothetical protein
MFDDAEKHVSDSEVQDVTQDAEKMADKETGDKYDSEVQDAGNLADKEADKEVGKEPGQQQ